MIRRRLQSVRRSAWILLALLTAFTALSVYLRFVLPSYAFLYIFQPLTALAIAGYAYYASRGLNDRLRRKNDKLFIVLAVVCAWFVLYFLSGFLTTYVKNALFSTPLSIFLNIFAYGAYALASEYSRHRIMLLAGRKNVVWFGIIVAIIFAIQQINFYAMFIDRSPEQTLKYIVSDILPIMASSLLLTYLAVSAGLSSMLAYRFGILAITLLMPIIPKYDWYLLGVSNLILVIAVYISIDRFQVGRHAAHRRHYVHVKRSYDVMFFAVLIALVLFMTGFLQYKPVAILSDSMQPVYGRGSMVIVQTVTDPMDINIGDIIQYTTTDKVITHRVQEIKPASDGSGDRTFVTKGDNNSSADPPIKASQATGIIKAQVPYIGYPTIWLRALTR